MLRAALTRFLRLDIAHRHRALEGFGTAPEAKIPSSAGSTADISVIQGVPDDQLNSRVVRIYKPAPSTMQSGTVNYHKWQLNWAPTEDARWQNPLTGWTSSQDPMQMLTLSFETPEDAIAYCRKNGWQFEVSEPNEFVRKGKNYGEKFKYRQPPKSIAL